MSAAESLRVKMRLVRADTLGDALGDTLGELLVLGDALGAT